MVFSKPALEALGRCREREEMPCTSLASIAASLRRDWGSLAALRSSRTRFDASQSCATACKVGVPFHLSRLRHPSLTSSKLKNSSQGWNATPSECWPGSQTEGSHRWRCPQADTYDDMMLGRWMTSIGVTGLHEPGFHQRRPKDYHPTFLRAEGTPVRAGRAFPEPARMSCGAAEPFGDVCTCVYQAG